ncbi:sigma-70 family RNA polymerase sigma factor [Stackebrandtia sp.]|uniref:sigma-70 family RNA polymerase sigma factor n=1 Tax=Stackebrandtia sp. TaxID=2023065 RepID=UPI0032C22366
MRSSSAARGTDPRRTRMEFEARIEALRPEMLAHCYRMLGSYHDAEDLAQETLLRAWRARDRYDEQRATLRTWLYRIATNACLTALDGRGRRPLPSGLGAPSQDAAAPLEPQFEVPWLQPFPDRVLGSPDPASAAAARSGLRLAFVAAMQALPARQRAVLVLREVLAFSANEVAEMLETSAASVNSALQRARAGLDRAALNEDDVTDLSDAEQRARIDSYVTAFERADVAGLTRLLTDEAVLEMPPVPLWYRGRDSYGAFMTHLFERRGRRWRMAPTEANGQPAVAAYIGAADGAYRLHTLHVFDVVAAGIRTNVVFQDPAVLGSFGLPPTM